MPRIQRLVNIRIGRPSARGPGALTDFMRGPVSIGLITPDLNREPTGKLYQIDASELQPDSLPAHVPIEGNLVKSSGQTKLMLPEPAEEAEAQTE